MFECEDYVTEVMGRRYSKEQGVTLGMSRKAPKPGFDCFMRQDKGGGKERGMDSSFVSAVCDLVISTCFR